MPYSWLKKVQNSRIHSLGLIFLVTGVTATIAQSRRSHKYCLLRQLLSASQFSCTARKEFATLVTEQISLSIMCQRVSQYFLLLPGSCSEPITISIELTSISLGMPRDGTKAPYLHILLLQRMIRVDERRGQGRCGAGGCQPGSPGTLNSRGNVSHNSLSSHHMTIFGQNHGTNHVPDTRLHLLQCSDSHTSSTSASMEGHHVTSRPPLSGLGEPNQEKLLSGKTGYSAWWGCE